MVIYLTKITLWYLWEVLKEVKASQIQTVITAISWIRYQVSSVVSSSISLRAPTLQELALRLLHQELQLFHFQLRFKCKAANAVLYHHKEVTKWVSKMRTTALRRARGVVMPCSTPTSSINSKCSSKFTSNSSTISWVKTRVQVQIMAVQIFHRGSTEAEQAMNFF